MNKIRIFLITVLGLLWFTACGGAPSFSLGGTISGLGEGKGILLRESVSGQRVVAVEDGSFAFEQKLSGGASYKVEIEINPAAQGCVIKNGEGVVGSANIDNIKVICGDSGTVDKSFGNVGVFIEPMIVLPIEINSMTIQPDGKILAAGQYYNSDTDKQSLIILRTDADGVLDGSFANGGKFRPASDYWQAGYYIQLLDDGSILAGGTSSSSGYDFFLLKLNPSGQPDPGFGVNGSVITDFDGGYDRLLAAFPDSNGGYLAVGTARVGGVRTLGIVRYAANGSPVAEFGVGGKRHVDCPLGTGYLALMRAISQPDGKIVLVGTSQSAADDYDLLLVRINPDGSIDNGFGTNGWVSIDYGGESEKGLGLALQPDGKIIAVGYQDDDGDYRAMAVRVNPDGSVDESFGSSGFVFTDFGGERDRFVAAAIQPDGKIVIAGVKRVVGENDKIAMVRLLDDGRFDYDFGDIGKSVVEFAGNGKDIPNTLLIQPDGRILVGGERLGRALLMTRFWH